MSEAQLLVSELHKEHSDRAFQAILLDRVSRTFALTIPQLPDGLHDPVANAYLLCRIVDTIEDEATLSSEQKEYFCTQFANVVKTGSEAGYFCEELASRLSTQTLPAEHALIQVLPRVIRITHQFDPEQISAITDCVETMAKGMIFFQSKDLQGGLASLSDMNEYCYYVAGCVGEMLAKLFCQYSPEIALHKEKLLQLSVSFGQGLQMTNILKDIWEDAKRNVCWLPQDIFTEVGFDLKLLTSETSSEEFKIGLAHVVSIANDHLQNALHYTLLIPRHETGIRNFCLWALAMAVLTLKKIKHNLEFNSSDQVKITRNSVKAVICTTSLIGRSNTMLNLLYKTMSGELRTPDWNYSGFVTTPPCENDANG